MSKPTDYQRWWMQLILDGREATANGLLTENTGQFVLKIRHRSIDATSKRGWIMFKWGYIYLTPLGKSALES